MENLSYYLYNNKNLQSLLSYTCTKIPKNKIYIPNPNFIEDCLISSSRSIKTIQNMSYLFNNGRLRNTGYLSILPVDQGVEHSVGSAFSKNIDYFNPENIFILGIESGCNGIASTFGILRSYSRKYAHKIPLILKINHNQLLSYPNTFDQVLFSQVKEAWNMGCIGIGATIYFGSKESNHQIKQISEIFHEAHELGLITILWAYLRNSNFNKDQDYHLSADLTGQANHLAVTLGADIVKQKLPKNNGGYTSLKFGKTDSLVYSSLSSSHPIDLTRYQVASTYTGHIPLINSGGSSNDNYKKDIIEAIEIAIINKRAGGMGMISGRKAFQKPLSKGIELLNIIQDVYLSKEITIA